MRTIIYNGLIINEQKEVTGYIVIKDELIETVASGEPDKISWMKPTKSSTPQGAMSCQEL